MHANGQLSPWNAQAQLVDKSDEPGAWDEPRVTFNYQNVVEDPPACFVELMSRVHDYLGHPTHRFFHKLDLKHGYWSISVHPEDRHYFAFTIPGIGQLQPTRMPQGSCSAGFSFTELMYIVLGVVPPSASFPGMESALVSDSPTSLPKCTSYVDDIFSGCRTFDEGYSVLEDELLPRIDWARLRLSFKKLELFVEETIALGVHHKSGGVLYTKAERCDKIRNWPTPRTATDVRAFLGTIGMTRRWVKNFGEIKQPLSRLTGNVDFVWDTPATLSFHLLREKCAEATEMHGWNFLDPVRMYTDASQLGAGCAITQLRCLDKSAKPVEVPIIYDSFTFTKTQRNYGTYKRELCSMVEFARKYDYMLRGPQTAVIFTDHKPLTYFLASSAVDGIYARWAFELRSLNITIEWIPGARNSVADALSRTIFPESNDTRTLDLAEFGDVVTTEDGTPEWVWKDGRGGYNELIERIGSTIRDSELRKLMNVTLDDTVRDAFSAQVYIQDGVPGRVMPDWVWKDGPAGFEGLLKRMARPAIDAHLAQYSANLGESSQSTPPDPVSSMDWEPEEPIPVRVTPRAPSALDPASVQEQRNPAAPRPPHVRYANTKWYGDIYEFFTTGIYPAKCCTRIQRAAFINRVTRFTTLPNGDLYLNVRGVSERCITEKEVAPILTAAHDDGGHFQHLITLRRLKPYYWPNMSKDAVDYIRGCLVCARYGTALRSQTSARVTVNAPMEVLGLDFVGPFPKLDGVGVYYILIAIDYFTRFVWAKATPNAKSETAIDFLGELFETYGTPVGVYLDPGPHFGNKTKVWAESKGVVWCNAPVAAKNAVGMIEKAVDVLKRVLFKMSNRAQDWPQHLRAAVFEVNQREIAHLTYSPSEIMFGFDPVGAVESRYPTVQRSALSASLADDVDVLPDENEHLKGVVEYMTNRCIIRHTAQGKSEHNKDISKQRHDLGVRSHKEYSPGDLVMLYDHSVAGDTLKPTWRGPFVINGFGGDMKKSYLLRQIDGTPIDRHYHGDSLKPFRLREGYLVTQEEEGLPVYQNIRFGKAGFRVPPVRRAVPGAWRSDPIL
jgi:hypothetical protein